MNIRNGLTNFLILCFSILSFWVNAQTKQIAKPIIIPEHPTVVDSVYVFLQSATSGLTTSFGYETRVKGDSIFIHHCVKGGVMTEPRIYQDTLNLGLLTEGEYILRFTVYSSSRGDTCDYKDPIDSSVTFQVTLNTSGSNIKPQKGNRLYPNPTNGKQILELNIAHADGDEMHIAIHDLTGKELTFFSLLAASEEGPVRIPIDLSRLPAGYYSIRVKIGGELIVIPSIKN